MNRRVPSEFNRDAFKPSNGFYTTEQRYWGGFLLTDGYLQEMGEGRYRLRLELSQQDEDHLEKFKQFLKSTHSIYRRHRPHGSSAEVTISNPDWLEDLKPFGVVLKKSLIAEVPEAFWFDRHFWRGVVDGDGGIDKPRERSPGRVCPGGINLCGTFKVVEAFKAYAVHVTGEKILPEVRQFKRKKDSGFTFEFNIRSLKALKLIEELYQTGDIALTRKALAAEQFLSLARAKMELL